MRIPLVLPFFLAFVFVIDAFKFSELWEFGRHRDNKNDVLFDANYLDSTQRSEKPYSEGHAIREQHPTRPRYDAILHQGHATAPEESEGTIGERPTGPPENDIRELPAGFPTGLPASSIMPQEYSHVFMEYESKIQGRPTGLPWNDIREFPTGPPDSDFAEEPSEFDSMVDRPTGPPERDIREDFVTRPPSFENMPPEFANEVQESENFFDRRPTGPPSA